jgi:hypothetical protein
MKTNDLKKGAKVLLAYGDQNGDLAGSRDLRLAVRMKETGGSYHPWEAEVWDNMKGNTRVCNVFGFETEAGSVYSHDILAYWDGTKWMPLEYTPSQMECLHRVKEMGL